LASHKEEEPAGSKLILSEKVAKAILDSDPSILSLLVLASDGKVSSVGRSSRLAKESYADQQTVQRLGTVATVILGAAKTAEPLLGSTEFVMGVFKMQKVLVMSLPDYDVSLSLRLSRTASAESVRDKISKILASR